MQMKQEGGSVSSTHLSEKLPMEGGSKTPSIT